MLNIVANIEIKISTKYIKRTKEGRSLKGTAFNTATKVRRKKEKRQREKETR